MYQMQREQPCSINDDVFSTIQKLSVDIHIQQCMVHCTLYEQFNIPITVSGFILLTFYKELFWVPHPSTLGQARRSFLQLGETTW